MHGGLSTGPRTPEGLERIRDAHWKTGKFTKEAKESRRWFVSFKRNLARCMEDVERIEWDGAVIWKTNKARLDQAI